MELLLAVAAGGAAGAVGRYLVVSWVGRWFGTGFPFGTIVVNVVGSFALGLLIVALTGADPQFQALQSFLVIGILGAFTTFSTFSLDVALLYERGSFGRLAIYVLGSVVLSIAGLFAGLSAMRGLLG